MGERHTRQNNAGGSSWGRTYAARRRATEAPLPGFYTLLTSEEGTCFVELDDGHHCPLPKDHGWLDRDSGAPHPGVRLVTKQEEVVTMTTESETKPHITAAEIKEFTKAAKALIMEIVNEHGIKYRVIDGGHCLLYPPVATDRPFKISAKRQDPVNRQILEVQFMEKYGLRQRNEVSVRPQKASEKPAEKPVPAKPVAKPQPKAAEPPVPPAEPVTEVEGENLEDVVRGVIETLHRALGIEDEAVEAIVSNDNLRAQIESLTEQLDKKTVECNHLRDSLVKDRDALARAEKALRVKEDQLTAATERANTAEADINALRKILGGK